MPGYNFQIEALSHEEIKHELNKSALDFILTNPGHYVRLEDAYGATRIATFKASYKDQELTRFSSVIFASKNSGIKHTKDLPGRRFAAVNQNAFGGFQLAQMALKEQDIDALKELDILWLGFPHSDVVKAVLEGKADAGTVRTGVLERMVANQTLDLSQLNVLAQKYSRDFPLLHSVDLYPEWPFATLPTTDPSLATAVTIALLQMTAFHPAADSANGRGWTIPLDYSSVHKVFRILEIEPYPPIEISIGDLLIRYWLWVVGATILLMLTWLALLRFLHINRQYSLSQDALISQKSHLENKVEQRTKELRDLNNLLKADVESRAQSEQSLAAGCKTMQALYQISLRNDLNHEQRLQSILDLARQYLDTEFAMLSSISNQKFEVCKISPAQKNLPAPLDTYQAKRAIEKNELITTPQDGKWGCYMANPIYVAGDLRCLLELSSTGENLSYSFNVDTELKMQILKLVSQWLGNEIAELEKEKRTHKGYKIVEQRFTNISPREKQVLDLLVNGESNKSAAKILNISPKTIELHRSNLLRKTQAKSSVELVKLAVQLQERDESGTSASDFTK